VAKPNQKMFISCLFSVCYCEVYFEERFNRGWEKRWVKSSRSDPGKLLGRFRVSAGSYYVDRRQQRGLQTLDDKRQYLISAKFKKCFNTTGKDMVFQFSVKNEGKIEFGQTKMKLFAESFKQNQFSSKSPYHILFGPDFHDWDRHHIEFRIVRNRTNYVSMKPILAFQDHFTHVYSLIIFANQTYQIRKDNFIDIENHLEDDFNYCQPRLIPDPFEVKPADWEDIENIDDPDDLPPPGYDNVPQFIPDNAAIKPANWDESRMGAWAPPLIPNPNFKGTWKPRQIPNPAFRGDWIPRNITNPDHNPDYGFGKPEDLCYVGIDVEQDVSGVIWDNIIVTDDVAYAEQVMEETFFTIQDAERQMYSQSQQKKEKIDQSLRQDGAQGDDDTLPSEL